MWRGRSGISGCSRMGDGGRSDGRTGPTCLDRGGTDFCRWLDWRRRGDRGFFGCCCRLIQRRIRLIGEELLVVLALDRSAHEVDPDRQGRASACLLISEGLTTVTLASSRWPRSGRRSVPGPGVRCGRRAAEWAGLGLWRCASSVSGRRLIAASATWPYLITCRRRLMPDTEGSPLPA